MVTEPIKSAKERKEEKDKETEDLWEECETKKKGPVFPYTAVVPSLEEKQTCSGEQ